MIEYFNKFDEKISILIRDKIHTDSLRKYLSKINRGETLFFILIYILYIYDYGLRKSFYILSYIAVFSFFNDWMVLYLKKKISRGRPLIQVLGKVDKNPDMRYSFPSAHSSNSMLACILLVHHFGVNPWIFLITFFSGFGRMITLHHYLSDVLAGWILGIIYALIPIYVWSIINKFGYQNLFL